MESQIAASEEHHLIEGLRFGLGPVSRYVVDRRMSSWNPGSGNTFSSRGIRTIRFTLAGSNEWLVPDSVRLAFTVVNDDATNALIPYTCNPLSFFSRLTVYSGGTKIEDIENYNRTANMFDVASPAGTRMSYAIEGFGHSSNTNLTTWYSPEPVPASSQRRVLTPLLSGLLSGAQTKWWPLAFAPLVVELEVANSDEPVRAKNDAGADISQSWHLEDVQLLSDVAMLDSEVQSTYAAHVASGEMLPVNITGMVTQRQGNPGQAENFDITVIRGLTAVKSVMATMYQAPDGATFNLGMVNYFWHPMGTAFDQSRDRVQLMLKVGSKNYPQYPIDSLAEAYFRFKQAVGKQWGETELNISPLEWRYSKFIAGFDVEKCGSGASGLNWTGTNTQGGEAVRLEVKGAATASGQPGPSETFIVVAYDAIVNIRSTGAELLTWGVVTDL